MPQGGKWHTRWRKTVEQAAGTGLEREHWTTGADHGRMTLANELGGPPIGPPIRNPGCANNRGLPFASGNPSYQIVLFPKPAYGDDIQAKTRLRR